MITWFFDGLCIMTGKNEKENRLSDTEVFGSMRKEQLVEIAQVIQGKVVPANTIIFRQGDPGDSFYIINSGKIRVFLRGEDGVETHLKQLGPGDSFGEIALLTDEPRSTYIELWKKPTSLSLPKRNLTGF